MSGFGWNEDRYMVTATDWVWEDVLAVRVLQRCNFMADYLAQRHKKYAWFRTHPFPLHNDLATLCENTFAVGEHAFAVGAPPVSQGFDATPIGAGAAGETQASDEDEDAEVAVPRVRVQFCHLYKTTYGLHSHLLLSQQSHQHRRHNQQYLQHPVPEPKLALLMRPTGVVLASLVVSPSPSDLVQTVFCLLHSRWTGWLKCYALHRHLSLVQLQLHLVTSAHGQL